MNKRATFGFDPKPSLKISDLLEESQPVPGVVDNSYRGQNSNMHMCEVGDVGDIQYVPMSSYNKFIYTYIYIYIYVYIYIYI